MRILQKHSSSLVRTYVTLLKFLRRIKSSMSIRTLVTVPAAYIYVHCVCIVNVVCVCVCLCVCVCVCVFVTGMHVKM
jgi:hypothetical protein